MNTKILDFISFRLATKYTPATDTTITIIATSDIYTLALQRAGGNLSDFRLTLVEDTDTSKKIRIAISSVASESLVNGKKQYVLTVKQSDSSNLMVGMANDDDGTGSNANIIAGNLSSLGITQFSVDSVANVVVGSAEYNVLLSAFNAASTESTETAGEEADSTGTPVPVSLHTDGKYYKYHATNYPDLQGTIKQGETVVTDGTFTLVKLNGTSTGYTGLSAGRVFADNTGAITQTESVTTKFLGRSRGATIVDQAVNPTSKMTDAELATGTATISKTVSAAQLATLSSSGVSSSVFVVGTTAIGDVITYSESSTLSTNAINFGHIAGGLGLYFPVILNGTLVTDIDLRISRVGNPTDNLLIRIETDDGTGKPSGTLVDINAYSSIVGSSLNVGFPSVQTITFNDTFTPEKGKLAHVVLVRSGAIDNSNYYGFFGRPENANGFGLTGKLDSGVWSKNANSNIAGSPISTTGEWYQTSILLNDSDDRFTDLYIPLNQFIGFAKEVITDKGYCDVLWDGVDKNQAGLTAGVGVYGGTNQVNISETEVKIVSSYLKTAANDIDFE